MKKFFLTTVVFSVLVIIVCQENSITDLISTESINKSQTTASNITTGFIPLEGLLVLPGGFQSYFTIEGQINYSHELVQLDAATLAPQFYIALNLSVRAALTDESQNKFTILSESNDEISISIWEDEIFLLEKFFPIQGRDDGMVLRCTFHVTTIGVGLDEMWLELPDVILVDN
ncbi:MAG: hypothetical protein DRQ01_03565 [Ignavibacteriae bacterium]|nr:MAG: hypothetical protein DRQ01_03565 [Ignavibacteriota bacterium]